MPASAAPAPTVDVHVVAVDAVDPADAEALLAPADRERAAGILVPAARRRFVAARALLRTLVPDVRHDEAGRPVTDGGGHVSVSHSAGLVVVAVSAHAQVGVDVEALRPVPRAAAIARRMLPADDRDAVLAAPAEQRDAVFLRAWTRLEALVKSHGTGLGQWAAHRRSGLAQARAVVDVQPAAGYVAAVALGPRQKPSQI